MRLALVLAALLAATAAASWSHNFEGRCPLCQDAAAKRASLALPTPEHALVYAPVGEFATEVSVSIVDLDTGRLTTARLVGGRLKDQTSSILDAATLTALRADALRAWRLAPDLHPIAMAPGANLELDVISGDRIVYFQTIDPRVRALSAALEHAVAQAVAPRL